MAIKDWSTTPASNSDAPPDGFPEGMLPSQVNDSARKLMADVRAWYEEPSWVDYGYTVARATDTTFTVSDADATASFSVGRRVKLSGGSTVYGVVSASSYSSPNTTVTVSLDSGVVPADLSSASYSAVTSLAVPDAAWGSIGGTLSDQTDLQSALNGKAASSHTHSTGDVTSGTFATARLGSGTASSSTYLRGDGSWASLPSGTAPAWGEITGTLSNQTDLQNALNAKQATITGGATTIDTENLTASRALVSDGSGKVGVSAVTSTELSRLDGVTSSVQTQLNGKEPTLATNRKRQIFVQSATPSGQATGDLWVW